MTSNLGSGGQRRSPHTKERFESLGGLFNMREVQKMSQIACYTVYVMCEDVFIVVKHKSFVLLSTNYVKLYLHEIC